MGKYVEQYRRAEEQHRRLQQRIEEQCRRTGHARPVTRRVDRIRCRHRF